ncbi:MAG: family 16 glycosylhydrolase [Clostridiales bacterium]|nr:family 16 glycosylhydrolase [Clostridiales bacterium]
MKSYKPLSTAMVTLLSLSLLASCAQGGTPAQDTTAEATTTEATTTAPTTPTPELEGYKLLWSDEFDGTELNLDNWTREVREVGWTNNELQEYRDSEENVFVRDGNLVLKAIKTEKDGKPYYTSGKVNSQNKKDFLYGKVEVKAKVPEGQGLWPAIWMMPQDEQHYGQWPKCGEIDIMEVLGNDTSLSYSTIHYGEPHAEQQGTLTSVKSGSYSEDYHLFSVEWEPGEMRFYTDYVPVLTVNDWFTAVEGEDEKPYPAPFDQPFFVQMNLAVGGNWPGNPDETTNFDNAEFLIDYVRVYQKDEYNTDVTKPTVTYREALEDGNYIYNGDFAEAEDLGDEENWFFLLFNEGEGAAEIKDGEIVITSTNDGTEEYSVQLVQPDLPVLKGHSYRVTFEARADEPRDMVTAVTAPNAGWIRYLEDTKLDLTKDWQTYTYEFTSDKKDDNYGRLEFNMGNHGYTATIHIRNVRYEEI